MSHTISQIMNTDKDYVLGFRDTMKPKINKNIQLVIAEPSTFMIILPS